MQHINTFPLSSRRAVLIRLALACLLLPALWSLPAFGQSDGTPSAVVAPEALLSTPVGGMERTNTTVKVVPVTGRPFRQALRVVVGTDAPETNATQLTIRNTTPIEKGDALMASFFVRGASASGARPARMEFLFEKTVDPWTKSITQSVTTARNRNTWKQVVIPFAAAESYTSGEAMASFRLAFGPQTLEVAGLTLVNYGKSRTTEELNVLAAEKNPLGPVNVAVRLAQTRQTMRGFGGNFTQPRYGSTQPMDAVGEYNLKNLRVAHARVGIPLNYWTPEPGVYKDEAQAHAAFLQMQMLAKRKIPITGSVWEGPLWMLGGQPEQSGRTLPREKYDACIEAITRFLVTARDKYGVTVNYFSFNEADSGVNIKFTSAEMAEFIRRAGPRFAALKLKTKFLTGDTANGASFAAYARPLLEDRSIAPYLGPLAFHSWDVLGALESRYTDIAALGRQYRKPVWCTEAGHDAQLWHAANPWEPWENGLRTALAYERSLRLTGAEQIDYWTYQDNYPLVSKDGTKPFPVWQVVQQMEKALPPGAKVTVATIGHDELKALPTVGPGPKQFSVLLINPIGAGTATLTGLPPGVPVTVIQSTAGAQQRPTGRNAARVDRNGRLTVALPSRSVVTVLGGPSRTP